MSKITLWSRDGLLLTRRDRDNAKACHEGILRLDVHGIAHWLDEMLAELASPTVEVIVPVAHGAAFAALKNGQLAFPPIDYEQALPEDTDRKYRQERDGFAATGSPSLPNGLNLGAQLYLAEHLHGPFGSDIIIVPWAQYWAWHLTGVARSEVSSLGCHTDLWNPGSNTFSRLAQRRGWDKRFAPIAPASAQLGTLRPKLAQSTGLREDVQVLTGLHDSNAALHALRGFAQFADGEVTLLSTGTWFVAMRQGAEKTDTTMLPQGRDCLVNVDIHGQAIPSARFMGGRELEIATAGDAFAIDDLARQEKMIKAASAVIDRGTMLLPSLVAGSGPFPDKHSRWINEPPDPSEKSAAAALYAALMVEQMLDLLGTTRCLAIEGRFANSQVFTRAIASLRADLRVYSVGGQGDVSMGALRLALPELTPHSNPARIDQLPGDLRTYRARWLDEIGI